MAEIDRIVMVDIERDGEGLSGDGQESVRLRADLISTDPTRGAGMVGYSPSDLYPDPVIDEDDNIIKPSEKLDGYHVNFLNNIPSIFIPYIIPRPVTPSRVFAGDNPLLEEQDGVDEQDF